MIKGREGRRARRALEARQAHEARWLPVMAEVEAQLQHLYSAGATYADVVVSRDGMLSRTEVVYDVERRPVAWRTTSSCECCDHRSVKIGSL